MEGGRDFTEILVGMLGTAKAPSGADERLGLVFLVVAVAAWLLVEHGLFRLFARLLQPRPRDPE